MPFLEQSVLERGWDYSKSYADHSDEVRQTSLAVYCCPSRRSVSEAIGQGLLTGATTVMIRLPCGCTVPVQTSSSEMKTGGLGDYGGNHGDLSPGSNGLASDFYYGGNGTGIIISSQAKCAAGLPGEWVDKIKRGNVTDGLSNTILSGEMHVPMGRLSQAGFDAFIFNGDHVFNSTRIGGPTIPIVNNLRDESNGLVSWGSWHPGVCNFAFADGSVRAISNQLDTETLGYFCNRADGQASENAE
jgi:prepilin-type processing-associated H-X9-DG protein